MHAFAFDDGGKSNQGNVLRIYYRGLKNCQGLTKNRSSKLKVDRGFDPRVGTWI